MKRSHWIYYCPDALAFADYIAFQRSDGGIIFWRDNYTEAAARELVRYLNAIGQ